MTSNPTGYKTLTQADVDCAKYTRGKQVAAVAIASLADTSSSSNGTVPHPVAAVLGMSHNPVAYIASNASSMLERSLNGDSDSSVFQSVSDPSPPSIPNPLKEASPLHVLHLYWCCLTNGKEFPVVFDTLIDHGSSAA
jgi:hypothetical protein